jgi:hypothetical protein
MGAFYGSVQVRSEDRDRVKAVAEEVARRLQIHMLIAPVLNGWIGVYPEGSGQDQQVGEALFQGLKTTVWHVLVHDDDILAYWLWDDGQLVDSYHSEPGYFGEKNRAEEEPMVGKPEVLSQLVGGEAAHLRKLLARDGSHPLASMQLDELQSLTGVRNLTTSYEYLKEGETHGIKGWRQFVEVPAALIEAEAKEKRQTRSALASERRRLKKAGLLLTLEGREEAAAYACDLSDGFVVAWPDHGRQTVSFATYRAPWKEPSPLALDTPAHITGVASDASRRRIAMAAGSCVRVWDVAAGSWNLVADIPERDLALAVAISADGKLVAHSSRNEIVVSDVASGRPLFACPGVQCRKMAFHPSGDWIAVDGNPIGLIAVRDEPHWRGLYVGGKQRVPNLPKSIHAVIAKTDVDAVLEKTRATMEAMIEQMRRAGKRSGQSAQTEALVEKMRAGMEEQLEQQKSQMLGLKDDPQPPPRANLGAFATGFSRNGEWLWCGTNVGLRVYRWSDVPRSPCSDLMKPTQEPSRPFDYGQYIYAIAEETDGTAIIFGGLSGRLLRLELSTGQTRELIEIPGGLAIIGLKMSADGQTLGISTQAMQLQRGKSRTKSFGWQVWNYPLLRRQNSPT